MPIGKKYKDNINNKLIFFNGISLEIPFFIITFAMSNKKIRMMGKLT